MSILTISTFRGRLLTPEVVRGQLERLARRLVNGHVDFTDIRRVLPELTGLDEDIAACRFIDLVDALTIEDALRRGLIDPPRIVGRGQVPTADACRTAVEDALDELMAGVQ